MLGVVAQGELAIGEAGGVLVETGPADGRYSPYWVVINGLIEGLVRIDSIGAVQSARGASQCSYSVVNPSTPPAAGMVTHLVHQDHTLFGGIVKRVEETTGPDEAVKVFRVEAAGWEVVTARHIFTKQYTNTPAGSILRDLLTSGGLGAEGILAGQIDDGVTLVFVDAQHVRLADFIRDIGDAGGGVAFVDENKRLQFRIENPDLANGLLTNEDIEEASRSDDLDNYRNRQTVKVTSMDGATSVEVTRNDLVEQAARMAQEDGTGVYHVFDEVRHPTSNDQAELNKFGISVAFLHLQALGHPVALVRARLRRTALDLTRYVLAETGEPILEEEGGGFIQTESSGPLLMQPYLRIGQLVEVNFPGYAVVGTFRVMHREIEERGWRLLLTVELQLSSVLQGTLESLLQIVGAAKASVIIPGNVFNNSVTFLTSDTWNVPGSGEVEIQIDTFGGGGGGTSGAGLNDPNAGVGARGGHGGKVSTFKIYTAGTTLTITIGTNSVGGVYVNICPIASPGVGTHGAAAEVLLAGVSLARAVGGLRATTTGGANCPRAVGADSGGTGDFVVVGGGAIGGAGGPNTGNGSAGGAASVTIYY